MGSAFPACRGSGPLFGNRAPWCGGPPVYKEKENARREGLDGSVVVAFVHP